MQIELWKPIKGYEGFYEVSNFGNVRSINRLVNSRNGVRPIKGKPKIFHKTKKGYYRVSLFKKQKPKNFFVHRLVAITFIPNPLNLPQINHKNEIKTDNRVDNLEWCDAKYNDNYGTRTERIKLTWNIKRNERKNH